MSKTPYLTAPPATDRMPGGIPYIVGNEVAERFSYYGMRSIIYVYMTKHLLDCDGAAATFAPNDAKFWQHLFMAAVYAFPILGAILADWLLGKYRTILSLSIVYCLGHLALAAICGRAGLAIGLTLIAIGAGGIKPCVSSHVGDQFGERNQHLVSRVFGWFYFAINIGATVSMLLIPWLHEAFLSPENGRENLGFLPESWIAHFNPQLAAHVAFGLPGFLMLVATFVFWLGRRRFVHIPPGGAKFVRESFSREGLSALAKLIPLFAFCTMFFCLFDQTASAWVEQAESMDRRYTTWSFSEGRLVQDEMLESQIQAVNSILVLIYIPLFSYVVYPLLGRFFAVTPLRKIGIGLFLTALSFAVCGWVQVLIDRGQHPSIMWQILAYAIITAAEIMVSITGLEFSYTQAPNRMKAVIMSLYLLATTVGNLLTSLVNYLLIDAAGANRLPGANYYWFFTGLMLATAVTYVPFALFYKERRYVQEGEPADA